VDLQLAAPPNSRGVPAHSKNLPASPIPERITGVSLQNADRAAIGWLYRCAAELAAVEELGRCETCKGKARFARRVCARRGPSPTKEKTQPRRYGSLKKGISFHSDTGREPPPWRLRINFSDASPAASFQPPKLRVATAPALKAILCSTSAAIPSVQQIPCAFSGPARVPKKSFVLRNLDRKKKVLIQPPKKRNKELISHRVASKFERKSVELSLHFPPPVLAAEFILERGQKYWSTVHIPGRKLPEVTAVHTLGHSIPRFAQDAVPPGSETRRRWQIVAPSTEP
jgi:hypothetical protein